MSRFRAYAQLVRLPNVFTAWADIFLGGLALGSAPAAPASVQGWLSFACLLAASTGLYWAGMVWNDVFDIEQDRRERPFRPIPSGRVPRRAAVRLGSLLLVAGILFALAGGWQADGLNAVPVAFAAAIAVLVLAYDAWLKRTRSGPVAMGGCRFLNILMAVSWGAGTIPEWGLHAAAVIGVYIAGITWFARTEARASDRRMLQGAAGVILGAAVIALPLPLWFPPEASFLLFPYLLAIFVFALALPLFRAIGRPRPENVQAAVRRAILGLIALDAIMATVTLGVWGLAILLLLPPALWIGRWIYST